jgi:hypothetical protein
MAGQRLHRLPGSGLGKGHGLGDLGIDFGLDAGDVAVLHQMVLQQPSLEADDRPLGAPLRDFLLVAVELRVEHRMGAEAIGAAFEEIGAAGLADAGDGAAGGGLDGDHVHARRRLRRDAVGGRLGVDVGLGFRAAKGASHGVAIVLADKQHRDVPQFGEVHGLVELALGHGPFAEEADGDAIGARNLVAERQAPASGRPPPTMALPP